MGKKRRENKRSWKLIFNKKMFFKIHVDAENSCQISELNRKVKYSLWQKVNISKEIFFPSEHPKFFSKMSTKKNSERLKEKISPGLLTTP